MALPPGFTGWAPPDAKGREYYYEKGIRVPGHERSAAPSITGKIGQGIKSVASRVGGAIKSDAQKLFGQFKQDIGLGEIPKGILEPQKPLISQAPEGTKINPATYVGKAERDKYQQILGTDDWVLRKVTEADVQKLDAIASKLRDHEQWETLNKVINKVDNAVMAGGYSFIPKGVIKQKPDTSKPLPLKSATLTDADRKQALEAIRKKRLYKKLGQKPTSDENDKILEEYDKKVTASNRQQAAGLINKLSDRGKLRGPPEQLTGGKADKVPESAVPASQLKAGQAVESEHTSNPAMAREIARDHLVEDPQYYDKLKKVEGKASEPLYKPLGDPNKRGIENVEPVHPSNVGFVGAAKPTHSITSHKSPKVRQTDRPRSAGETAYSNIIHNQVEPTHEEWKALKSDLHKFGREQLMRLVRRFDIRLDPRHTGVHKLSQLRRGISDHVEDILEFGAGPTGVAPELGKDRRSGKHLNKKFTQFRAVRKF